MHLKRSLIRVRTLAALGAACAALGCTLTHSLDDLKGGPLSSAGSGGASSGAQGGIAGAAGGNDSDAGGAAAAGASSIAGAAGDVGDGSTALTIISPTDSVGWESVSVQFSQAMDPSTVTALTTGTLCGKTTLQLSLDSFTTCVLMTGAPTWNSDGTIVTFTPAAPLKVGNGNTYTLRVTQGAKTPSGETLAKPYEATVSALYSHTVDLSQTMPFLEQEARDTSTLSQYTLYLAWDADNLYLGMAGDNINSSTNAPNTVFVAYFGGTPGAMSGMTIGSQTATLDFPARYGIQWLGDQANKLVLMGNATGMPGAWDSNPLPDQDRQRTDNLIKIKVPLSAIGNPKPSLNFASGLIYTAPTPSTYATTPPIGAFSGSSHLVLDLTGHTLPKDSPPF